MDPFTRVFLLCTLFLFFKHTHTQTHAQNHSKSHIHTKSHGFFSSTLFLLSPVALPHCLNSLGISLLLSHPQHWVSRLPPLDSQTQRHTHSTPPPLRVAPDSEETSHILEHIWAWDSWKDGGISSRTRAPHTRSRTRLGVRALGVAERILTYGITLGASSDFTMLDRASNLTLGFVALNLTLGASEFLTSCGALGRLTCGLTNLVAHGLITLPLALGMAVSHHHSLR